MSWPDIIGMIGTALLILAYFLLQSGRVKGDNWSYIIMNFIAASLILYSLYFVPNLPSIVIEIFWITISVYGGLRKIRNG